MSGHEWTKHDHEYAEYLADIQRAQDDEFINGRQAILKLLSTQSPGGKVYGWQAPDILSAVNLPNGWWTLESLIVDEYVRVNITPDGAVHFEIRRYCDPTPHGMTFHVSRARAQFPGILDVLHLQKTFDTFAKRAAIKPEAA